MDTLILALRVMLSLAAVLGLLWVLQRRLTRRARAAGGSTITVVARTGVGSKASVAVVEAEGHRFVLGVTEHAVSVLHSAEAQAAPADHAQSADQPAPAVDFAAVLRSQTTARSPLGSHTPTGSHAATGRRAARANGPLTGSILSRATWKQTVEAFRQGRAG